MQYYNKFYRLNYFKTLNWLSKGAVKVKEPKKIDEEAKKKEKIVLFYFENGLNKTQEMFKVKKTTLYRWKKKYKEKGLEGLIPGDRTPIRKRQSKIRQEVKDYIKEYRIKYGNIHKVEIKIHLDEYCIKKGIKSVSTSTIGTIIRTLKENGELNNGKDLRLNGRTGKLIEYKRRRNCYYPKKPGDLMQIDSVHLNVYGKKRYLINAIDIKGRLAFSYEYKRLNSKNVVDFFKRAKKYFPFKIKRIQTDNGKEFKGYMNRYLNKSNLIHYLNLPRSPQTNGHIERFNRVIKEQFVYRNEEYLEDCELANQKIKKYLFWYNTQKYHKSLNYETPIIYTLAHLNPK